MPGEQVLKEAYRQVRDTLFSECSEAGSWNGDLSLSVISTATSLSAFCVVERHGLLSELNAFLAEKDRVTPSDLHDSMKRCMTYLVSVQNADGGWGDSDRSYSNIAASMLTKAALTLMLGTDSGVRYSDIIQGALERARPYLDSQGHEDGVRRRYGKDRTFAVPILMNCALAGFVPWSEVAQLPYEAAILPHWLLGLLQIPVVSYAVPALVAVGQVKFFSPGGKSWNPLCNLLRHGCVRKSLKVVKTKMPVSGGFLEAAPLTAFVLMSLGSISRPQRIPEELSVCAQGLKFLLNSLKDVGSGGAACPIDTNLATWLTTQSVNALFLNAQNEEEDSMLGRVSLPWILACQNRTVHPFTQAAAGGWGWTNLSGAVPDSDDTSSALLALDILRMRIMRHQVQASQKREYDVRASLSEDLSKIESAASLGIHWLLGLQNTDGGWPTFCRGWGALPFDASGADLTAHVLRALNRWKGIPLMPQRRIRKAIQRGFHFLQMRQRVCGAWIPLWFGNQDHPEEENPVYGTSRVLLAWLELGQRDHFCVKRALNWLEHSQNEDGSWGSSVEETAVATEVMCRYGKKKAAERALKKIVEWVDTGYFRHASPVGFYFAKLWYYERLYPLIFLTSALGAAVACTQDESLD